MMFGFCPDTIDEMYREFSALEDDYDKLEYLDYVKWNNRDLFDEFCDTYTMDVCAYLDDLDD